MNVYSFEETAWAASYPKETPAILDEVVIILKQNICMYFSFQNAKPR